MNNFNNIKRFLGLVAVVASLLVVGTILLRMDHGMVPKLPVRKLPLQVDISLQKFHYTETKQGVKQWDLAAEKAEYNKKKDLTYLAVVRLTVAGGAKFGDLVITADRAEYHNGTRDVVLSGKVTGVSSKGIRFSASNVSYLASRSLLASEERVRFSDGGNELEGVGMEFQTQTRRFKLKKDVSAVFRQQEAR
jgi:LPS export ABC transporter protein LptC